MRHLNIHTIMCHHVCCVLHTTCTCVPNSTCTCVLNTSCADDVNTTFANVLNFNCKCAFKLYHVLNSLTLTVWSKDAVATLACTPIRPQCRSVIGRVWRDRIWRGSGVRLKSTWITLKYTQTLNNPGSGVFICFRCFTWTDSTPEPDCLFLQKRNGCHHLWTSDRWHPDSDEWGSTGVYLWTPAPINGQNLYTLNTYTLKPTWPPCFWFLFCSEENLLCSYRPGQNRTV